jgi:hypothetical protein
MSLRDNPTVVIITLVVAVAALCFTIGNNRRGERIETLETQIKTLELSQELKLPELLGSLRSASGELKAHAGTINELGKARRTTAELRGNLERAVRDRTRLTEELAAKQKLLDSIFIASESFTLDEGKAKALAGYGVVVGLVTVDSGDKSAVVMLNNKQHTMAPGAIETIQVGNKIYKIIAEAVDSSYPYSADFTFVVVKAE